MAYTNPSYIDCYYKGKPIKVSPVILTLLHLIREDVKKKWDSVILITGEVGSGKSTIAQTLAGMYQKLRDKDLTLDNFTWHSEGLVDFAERDDNYEEPIIYDEAIQGGTGRDMITKQGKDLLNMLVTKRRKKHLTIVIVDQLQEFNRKFISRAYTLIDCRTVISNYQKKRGYFKVYKNDEILHIYSLLKKGIIRDIKQYQGRKDFARFWDSTDIFIDEHEYENKKIEETNRLLQDNTDKFNWSKAKTLAFALWSKGESGTDIANKVGIKASTYYNYIHEFKQLLQV